MNRQAYEHYMGKRSHQLGSSVKHYKPGFTKHLANQAKSSEARGLAPGASVAKMGDMKMDQLRLVQKTDVAKEPQYQRHASTNGRKFIRIDSDLKHGHLQFKQRVNQLTSNYSRRMPSGVEPKAKSAWVADTNIESKTIGADAYQFTQNLAIMKQMNTLRTGPDISGLGRTGLSKTRPLTSNLTTTKSKTKAGFGFTDFVPGQGGSKSRPQIINQNWKNATYGIPKSYYPKADGVASGVSKEINFLERDPSVVRIQSQNGFYAQKKSSYQVSSTTEVNPIYGGSYDHAMSPSSQASRKNSASKQGQFISKRQFISKDTVQKMKSERIGASVGQTRHNSDFAQNSQNRSAARIYSKKMSNQAQTEMERIYRSKIPIGAHTRNGTLKSKSNDGVGQLTYQQQPQALGAHPRVLSAGTNGRAQDSSHKQSPALTMMQELRGQEGQSQDMQQQAGGIRSMQHNYSHQPSDMDVKEDSVESLLAVGTKKNIQSIPITTPNNMEIITQPGHKQNMFSFENEQAQHNTSNTYDDQYQYRAARTEKNLRRFTTNTQQTTSAAPGQSTIPSSQLTMEPKSLPSNCSDNGTRSVDAKPREGRPKHNVLIETLKEQLLGNQDILLVSETPPKEFEEEGRKTITTHHTNDLASRLKQHVGGTMKNRPQTSGSFNHYQQQHYHFATNQNHHHQNRAHYRHQARMTNRRPVTQNERNLGPKNSYGLAPPNMPNAIFPKQYHHKSNQQTLTTFNHHGLGGTYLDNYKLGKIIGQGAYAIVRICQHRETQQKFAIKIYEKSKLNDAMKRRAVQREIMALKKINHPNIIKLHDLIETHKQICMVTDYISGISLNQYVKTQCVSRVVKEQTCRKFFKQIVEGFDYLHQKGIAHRDIKLDNILIEEKTKMIKIIDFGFACFIREPSGHRQRHKIFCGTPSYMCPEIVKKHEYDGQYVDLWALGVLLYAMLTGQFPFRGQSENELYMRIQRGIFKYPSDSLSKEAKQVVGKLIVVDPTQRMHTSTLLKESKWVGCQDLPMSIFENAGSIYRASSVDQRIRLSNHGLGLLQKEEKKENKESAEVEAIQTPPPQNVEIGGINKSLGQIHSFALAHLKELGYSDTQIDEGMRKYVNDDNEIYGIYQKMVNDQMRLLINPKAATEQVVDQV